MFDTALAIRGSSLFSTARYWARLRPPGALIGSAYPDSGALEADPWLSRVGEEKAVAAFAALEQDEEHGGGREPIAPTTSAFPTGSACSHPLVTCHPGRRFDVAMLTPVTWTSRVASASIATVFPGLKRERVGVMQGQ